MPPVKTKYLNVKEAGKFFPIKPRGDTVRNWIRTGVRDRYGINGGKPIILKSIRMGTRILTTEEWVLQFIKKTQKPEPKEPE